MRIDVPLGPAGSRIKIKMGPVPVERGGLAAVTDVEPLVFGCFRGAPITLVAARPRTGRQHQIRAHLALRGHGLLGDKMYGVDERLFLDVVERGRPMQELEEELGLARHALHAHTLQLTHPATGERASFRAPWPSDLAAILSLPEAAESAALENGGAHEATHPGRVTDDGASGTGAAPGVG
jgi:23S rRNA pseudouridine1911/1915/1917 synthase